MNKKIYKAALRCKSRFHFDFQEPKRNKIKLFFYCCTVFAHMALCVRYTYTIVLLVT